MRLMHFSATPVLSLYSKEQKAEGSLGTKPRGFWVSDESDYGWKAWCTAENFRMNTFVFQYEVTLAQNANILYLKSEYDIDSFTASYEIKDANRRYSSSLYINWVKLSEKYQGIIITPYIWSRRLHSRTEWYYTWDCASGCIWDAKAIEKIEILEPILVE